MPNPLRTLVAGGVFAASALALAPPADAACFHIHPPEGPHTHVTESCNHTSHGGPVTSGGPTAPRGGPAAGGGLACGFTSTADPTAEPGTQTGEVDGGPIVVASLPTVDDSTTPPTVGWDPAENPASGTIECDLQLNSAFAQVGANEDDNDAASASASGTAVVYLPPTQVSYAAADGDTVYSCTEWTLTDAHGNTEHLYLDDEEAGGTGDFVTDPTTAHCAIATHF